MPHVITPPLTEPRNLRAERAEERVYGQIRPEALGRVAESQVTNAKVLQSGDAEPETASVQVAQLVEQRTENPLSLVDAVANIGEFAHLVRDGFPHDAAQCRPDERENVTLLLPKREAQRACLRAYAEQYPEQVAADLAVLDGLEAAYRTATDPSAWDDLGEALRRGASALAGDSPAAGGGR